jgi:MFS transporter, DHA1 family, inner membrane transport protein
VRSELVRLTGAKTVANTALRWIPPFLPTLERAFGATTTQLTTALGIGELAGLSTMLVGPELDRGRERAVMIAGLVAVAGSAVVAQTGTVPGFTLSVVLLILGVANFTVAGHTWISHRVDYRWRARAIGVFETSWALALLVGAPLVALLIDGFGWRAPFVAVTVAAVIAALLVATTLPAHGAGTTGRTAPPGRRTEPGDRATARAWAVMTGSATLAASGLSVFVVSGAWLEDEFGVSTGGLGTIAMAFGAIELVASSSTAAFADRLGKSRSTVGGIVLLGAGLAVMVLAERLFVGVVGLLLFLFGFEYGFVTSLSLVSEAVPHARGRTLATSNAVGTVARGAGTIASGWLYGTHGITGTAALSAGGVTVALLAFVLSARVGAGRS